MIQYSMVDSLILLDARREVGVIGGVIRVSQAGMFSVLGSRFSGRSQTGESRRFMAFSSASEGVAVEEKSLNHRGHRGAQGKPGSVGFETPESPRCGQKNAGLKAATLISVSNPVSQVLW